MDELFRLFKEIAKIAGPSISCSMKITPEQGELIFILENYVESNGSGSLENVYTQYPEWADPVKVQARWEKTEHGIEQLTRILKKAENYREMPLIKALEVVLDQLDRKFMKEEVQAAYCTLKKLLLSEERKIKENQTAQQVIAKVNDPFPEEILGESTLHDLSAAASSSSNNEFGTLLKTMNPDTVVDDMSEIARKFEFETKRDDSGFHNNTDCFHHGRSRKNN